LFNEGVEEILAEHSGDARKAIRNVPDMRGRKFGRFIGAYADVPSSPDNTHPLEIDTQSDSNDIVVLKTSLPDQKEAPVTYREPALVGELVCRVEAVAEHNRQLGVTDALLSKIIAGDWFV
jgi:hypothetical protein